MSKIFRANIYFLIILLLEIFFPMVLSVAYYILGVQDVRIILFINHLMLFLVPAIIYLIVTKSSVKNTLKLNKIYLKDSMLIILLAFVCQPIMSFFSILTSFFFNNEIGVFISEITSTPYLILLSLVAVLPAITEEITIRGIVLSGYDNKNKYIAALVTGLFFGILHLDPQQFLYATVLGFILALLVRITNSIFSAALLHFLINGMSVTMSKLMNNIPNITETVNSSTEISLKGISFNEKIVLFIIYGSIALVFSTFVYMIIKKLEKWNTERGIIKSNDIETRSIEKEKIINWPFIGIIAVYATVIIIQTILYI